MNNYLTKVNSFKTRSSNQIKILLNMQNGKKNVRIYFTVFFLSDPGFRKSYQEIKQFICEITSIAIISQHIDVKFDSCFI